MNIRENASNKKRLIDYDEIRRLFDAQYKETVRLIRDGETHLDNLAEGFTEADRIIRKIPTVDAVEVVRCKDCRYRFKSSNRSKGVCPIINADIWMDDDDFCSHGEQKEGVE